MFKPRCVTKCLGVLIEPALQRATEPAEWRELLRQLTLKLLGLTGEDLWRGLTFSSAASNLHAIDAVRGDLSRISKRLGKVLEEGPKVDLKWKRWSAREARRVNRAPAKR
jgi:hypothetical protein